MGKLFFIIVSFLIVFTVSAEDNSTTVLRDADNGVGILSQKGTDFGFFMPETAGYFLTGISCGDKSLWLSRAAERKIKKLKRGWSLVIKDPVLEKGILEITVLPLTGSNGLIMEVEGKNLPEDCYFIWTYGGCSAGNSDEDKTQFLKPENCLYNVFSTEINAFTVYYGQSMRLKVMMGVSPLDTEIRLSDARKMSTPLELWESGKKTDSPVISSRNKMSQGEKYYYCIYRQNQVSDYDYYMLPGVFNEELTNKKSDNNEKARSATSFGPDFHF